MQTSTLKRRPIHPHCPSTLLLFLISVALTISGVSSRVLSPLPLNDPILISDGIHGAPDYEFLTLDPPKNVSKAACLHVYGFLPCADNIGGYAFQVFSFGCLLVIGDYFLSEGRSKLFVIFEVGFYGGIVFPLLTMFPRIVLMLSPALSASHDGALAIVGNNVGVTVGHTVFALTMQWGACVVFGLTSPSSGQSTPRGSIKRTTSDTKNPRRGSSRKKILKNVVEASVDADPKNKKAAGIMLLTLAPFLMVTLPDLLDAQSWSDITMLISLIISCSSTVVYFVYSYFDTADQKKSLDHAKFELMSEVHKHLQTFSPQSLIRDGQLSKESLKSLFDKIDRNKDGKIQISELKDLTVEFGVYGRMKCDINELANTLLVDFDKDKDGELDENEFEEGVMKLLNQYKFDNPDTPRQGGNTCIYRTASDSVHVKNLSQGEESSVLKLEMPKQTLVAKLLSLRTLRAVIKVVGGMLMVLFLAKPFMININLLSVTAGVPSFYSIFAVIPLVRNLKNTLSAHFCRKKDKARIASEKFSEIYKDVTMNNLMGMSIVLAIVYTKGLKWDYSTEALLAVAVGLAIGLPAYVRSTYPFWICVLAFAMYISSLVLIYVHYHLRGQN
ncbi:Calcium-binding EF-hand family protein [Raphanus sativus]|uniref:Sodium/calcium exchanger NCL-like n=1 Tax=Raphanus sativus TaxID=3726 RepID=A0A6J0MSS5_RAPSA|nr:sodium/calcium exchanger NCL-like [Raphanus sativus]XP_056860831.1 sodium/calcium exchanger NCL-like [Raphanus sativus]KAJ4907123.1 Calcium-binding EF-hand family protein [Raphanus sativus]